ncbi:chaperonin 10-like protein [Exophiala viscosa]|uniref:Chaperonin 10-like protein n=1 Tax=Exophiala viscosa TaxID=2486360 RepID=A0AAN6II12_9EURO|nr:chaperonin 10-like protein [Exophiala viscosa]
MPSQKAIAVNELAHPVKLIDRPIPKPGSGQVLVKVSIAGLNPHDGRVREIAYFVGKENLPATFAVDIVGKIAELGPDVTSFNIGDQVFGQGDPALSDTKGSQEYALLEADFIAPLPIAVTPDQTSTIILNALTSYVALFSQLGFGLPSPLSADSKGFDYSKVSMVIVGGNSACGKFGIQLAKWAGVGTIILTAGIHAEKTLKEMGANLVIDRCLSDDNVYQAVRHAVGDDLLYVCDTVNADDQTLGVRLLSDSKEGTFVPLRPRDNAIDATAVGSKRAGYRVQRFVAGPVLFRQVAAEFFKALPNLIDDGVLQPTPFNVIKGLDADEINKQLDGWRDGGWPTRANIHVAV